MALKIKASARSAAQSVPVSVPDRFRPVYTAVSAPDPFVSARSVPVPDAVPAPPAAGSVPVPESGSVTVRPWFSEFIIQVAVPGFSRPFYVSKYYRGRYSLTRDPLYAKTWSSPVLALQHAVRVRDKLVDYPYSFG